MKLARRLIGIAGVCLLLSAATLGPARQGNSPLAEITYLRRGADGRFVVSSVRPDGSTHRDWLTMETLSDDGFGWSPDGSTLAVAGYFAVKGEGRNVIFLVNSPGGRIRRMIIDGWLSSHVDWSRDSRHLLAELYRYNAFHLFVFDRTGQMVRQATALPAKAGDYSWSPDGSSIAYSDANHLFTRAAIDTAIDTAPDLLVRAAEGASFTSLVWSPDGQFIAYDVVVTALYQRDTCVVRVADGVISCFPLFNPLTSPTPWSPDAQVLWVSYCDAPSPCSRRLIGTWQPFTDTVFPRVDEEGYALFPTPSPDGSAFAYIAGFPALGIYDLMVARADGSHRRLLARDIAFVPPAWRPAIDLVWSRDRLLGGGLLLAVVGFFLPYFPPPRLKERAAALSGWLPLVW